MKSPHPADEFEAHVINHADAFRAQRHEGRGEWTRCTLSDRAEAERLALGGKWLVYAVDAAGRSAQLTAKNITLARQRREVAA